jgi:hypothetical protein
MNSSLLRRRAAGVLAALLVALCFAGPSLVHAADSDPCAGASKDDALLLGHEARAQGDFRVAAECYLLADEPVLADRVLAQNFVRSASAASAGMSDTLATAKEQARAIRESMRRR